MMLTEHFSAEELTASDIGTRAGVDNTPDEDVLEQLHILAGGLERIRQFLGRPIHVNSGYRCPALNKLVGGAPNSQHMTGNAADIICPAFGSPLQLCEAVVAMPDCGFDQVIYEFTWCHVSFVASQPRGSVLTRRGAQYVEGLVGGGT